MAHHQVRDHARKARDHTHEALDHTRNHAREARNHTREAVDHTRDAVDHTRGHAREARDHTREARDQTRDHAHEAENFFQKIKKYHPSPLSWLGIIAAGGILATIVVTALIVFTPVFIFFSPILVPLGFVLFLCAAGLLTAGGAALASITAIWWVYKYFKGRHPPGSEHVNYAMHQIQDTTEQVKHKTRDFDGQIHTKAQEAARGA